MMAGQQLLRKQRAIQADSAADAQANVQAKFFRGLSDPTRLRIVRILLAGPQPVGALVNMLRMGQSRVSNHLACLKWCGYASAQRIGKSVVYRVSDPRVRLLLEAADAIVADNAAHVAECARIDTKA
jgi:DNA-binding transcriptional ArsR family regulator